MTKSSLASRPPQTEPVALVSADTTTPSPFSRAIARVKAMLAEKSDSRLAQLVAGKVFLVRVGNALLALASQVLLARWMGSFEFGIYVYAWTWVLMIGALSDMGLSTAARRFIPEYAELNEFDLLRGFLSGSRWLAFAIATAIGFAGVARGHARRPAPRSVHRHSALSRLRHHSDLRAGAGPGRHRTVL